MLDYNLYYDTILTAINKIESSAKDRKSLDKEDTWDATLMRLQVIGENTRRVPTEIKRKYKELPWKSFSKLRNIISHRYEKIEKELIWKFISNKLPLLKKIMKEELK
jgi:uncharacterized protein with HEPN domain